jgi:uncharacterized protein with GYD domain
LLLIRNDAVGAARMLQGLTAGWDEFGSTLAGYGGELVDLYALAGRYDAAVIADFADPAGVLAFALAATSQGQYVEALPVFDRESAGRAEESARAAAAGFAAETAKAVDAAASAHQDKA